MDIPVPSWINDFNATSNVAPVKKTRVKKETTDPRPNLRRHRSQPTGVPTLQPQHQQQSSAPAQRPVTLYDGMDIGQISNYSSLLFTDAPPLKKVKRYAMLDSQPVVTIIDSNTPVISKPVTNNRVQHSVKVLKIVTLSYKPKIEFMLTLNGINPEARIVTPECVFVLESNELTVLLGTVDQWKSGDGTIILNNSYSCEQPNGSSLNYNDDDELEFKRYNLTEACPIDFNDNVTSMLTLNAYSKRKLIGYINMINVHVSLLIESKAVIELMFHVVCENYLREFHKLGIILSDTDNFLSLVRVVCSYVQVNTILKDFDLYMTRNNLSTRLNHFNLYSIANAQLPYIMKYLKEKI